MRRAAGTIIKVATDGSCPPPPEVTFINPCFPPAGRLGSDEARQAFTPRSGGPARIMSSGGARGFLTPPNLHVQSGK